MISYQRLNQQPIRMVSNALSHIHDDLKIELDKKEILILDQGSGITGQPLKGTVKLIPDKPMNVRSITLIFYGKMNVSWVEGTSHNHHHHKEERILIEQRQQFVPHADQPPKTVYTFPPGVHSFHFEFALPPDLPQSLNIEGGQITYRVKAIVERTAFQHKIIKKEDIRIIRCMLPSLLELEQTLEIHNTWAERMRYDIQLPSKVYACGSKIPINVQITPLASDFRVRYLLGAIKEVCTYDTGECSKEDVRIIRQLKLDDPFADRDVWTKDFELNVPTLRSRYILCDADTEMIRIRHKLEFVIALQSSNGQSSELRCSVPAIIVCSTCQHSARNALPAYDQSSRSRLCMSTPMDTSNALFWHGVDLSRVPSYRTVASTVIPRSPSLPDYDQLSISSRSS